MTLFVLVSVSSFNESSRLNFVVRTAVGGLIDHALS